MKNPQSEMTIDGKTIGLGYPSYFSADMAANHEGDLELAKHLIILPTEFGAGVVYYRHLDERNYVSDKVLR